MMIDYLHLVPALASIIVGISAIAFNKYPASEVSLIRMKKKYGYVNQKKLAKIDGAGYLLTGIIWACATIIHVAHLNNMIILFVIILFILYLRLRYNFLNKINGEI